MSQSPESSRSDDLPEHEKQAWDAIVADLSGQLDLGPGFPRERSLPPILSSGDHPDPLADPDEFSGIDDDEVGYEPPHPPPLPKPADTVGRFAWASVVGGPTLIVLSNLLGWETWLAGLGVAATVAGFAVLVARMKERDDDEGNGAVV